MNLYLKHGKKISTVTSIYLKDFHIPAVGTVEIDHTVEPAIWFKSLIIDSMYIDCDSRNVFWREKSQDDNTESELEESSAFVPRMTTAIFDGGDCENFELFDAIVKLLKAIEHKTFSEGKAHKKFSEFFICIFYQNSYLKRGMSRCYKMP